MKTPRFVMPAAVATVWLLAGTVLAQETRGEAAKTGGLFGLLLDGNREPAPRPTAGRRRSSPPPRNVRVPNEPSVPAAASKPISPPERSAPAASSAVPERSAPASRPATPDAATAAKSPPATPDAATAAKPPPTIPDAASRTAVNRPPATEPASPGKRAGVVLPEEEIRGEIEKPDIYFLLPRARDRSDEQVIRARLQREIRRPLIKEWLEETLLLE
ncbi:MAG: hypothetical protein QOD06_357 [Candidatus Binatota bacterium]|nr:hypothetical protein [Candidatus Binatota bacterium]